MRYIAEIAPGLANAGAPLEGIATAGQPDVEHLRRLADAGYRTIIDLRPPREERGYDEPETVRRAGMRYVSLPVEPEGPDSTVFERFRELMRDTGHRPALVHCSSANRVGALLIPYLILDEGRTEEDTLETARRVGLRSGELEQAALRYAKSGQA